MVAPLWCYMPLLGTSLGIPTLPSLKKIVITLVVCGFIFIYVYVINMVCKNINLLYPIRVCTHDHTFCSSELVCRRRLWGPPLLMLQCTSFVLLGSSIFPVYVSEPIKVQLTLVQHRFMLPFSKGRAWVLAKTCGWKTNKNVNILRE